jgi:cellobiose-specific phosphotransferase system component IIC
LIGKLALQHRRTTLTAVATTFVSTTKLVIPLPLNEARAKARFRKKKFTLALVIGFLIVLLWMLGRSWKVRMKKLIVYMVRSKVARACWFFWLVLVIYLFLTCLGGLGREGDSEAVFGACLSGLPSSGSCWFWLTEAVWYVHLDFWCFGKTSIWRRPPSRKLTLAS